MLNSLVQQAKIAFGNLLRLRDDQSAIGEQTVFELDMNLSPEVGISLPMYYDFYYRPLFRGFGSQRLDLNAFSSTKMNEWIHKMSLNPPDPRESSPEARAFFDLARNGNELIWTLSNLVAGLNACLTPEDAILVLSTAFSVLYDPRCVLPAHGSWSYPRFAVRCDKNALSPCTKHPQSDIPSQVRQFIGESCQEIKLQRPRYGLDCTIGKRLAEDFMLMSHLADQCGLQEVIRRQFASSLNTGPRFVEASTRSTNRYKADLTLTLVALASQPLPWTVKIVSGDDPYSMHSVLFGRSVLQAHKSATTVNSFVDAIQSAGISISVEEDYWSRFCSELGVGVSGRSWCYPEMDRVGHMEGVPKIDRQAWYESTEYVRLLKNVSWCPPAGAYQEWQRYRASEQTERIAKPLKRLQAPTAILADPYVRQLEREYGPSMIPAAAFAASWTEVDIDLEYHNYMKLYDLRMAELG